VSVFPVFPVINPHFGQVIVGMVEEPARFATLLRGQLMWELLCDRSDETRSAIITAVASCAPPTPGVVEPSK
jgi:hypothetical protein